jgi:hypothetical protein
MKKSFKKYLGLLMTAVLLMSSSALSASSSQKCPKRILPKHVAGTYQLSGFSNSLDGTGSAADPQSQGIIGQGVFNSDGTGTLTFVDLVPIVSNNIVDIHQENVAFTYTVGPLNGYGTVTLQNFPAPGLYPTFAVSYKLHKGKVVGLSLLTKSNTIPTARWTLIEAERFQ